jgi:hypothetical protein
MTKGPRLISFLLVLLLPQVLPMFAADPNPPSAEDKPLNILYTGRLFGYFRLPAIQRGDRPPGVPPCQVPNPLDPNSNLSTFGQQLMDSLASYHYKNRILVGTGDNFSLYLPSRILQPRPEGVPSENHYSKDQFYWDWSDKPVSPKFAGWTHPGWVPDRDHSIEDLIQQGLQVIPTDNVGCMLAYAGYDAIVPGRHDFYYGPERLRALARLLASMPREDSQKNDTHLHPVQMLAANLLINTSWVSGHSPIPDNLKAPLPFRIDSKDNPKIAFPKDGEEVLPWLSRVELNRDESGETCPTVNSSKTQCLVTVLGPDDTPDQNDGAATTDGKIMSVDVSHARGCWASGPLASAETNLTITVNPSCKQLNEIGEPPKNPANTIPCPPNQTCQAVTQISRIAGPCNDSAQAAPGGVKHTCLILDPIKPLQPGSYKLCFWDNAPAKSSSKSKRQDLRPVCNRFTVATPFFQFHGDSPKPPDTDGQKLPPPDSHAEKGHLPDANGHFDYQVDPEPFVVKTVCCDSQTVAIFGVVDLNLEQQVGALNSGWRTTKKLPSNPDKASKSLRQYQTAIKIVDPAKSLTQLMDYLGDCANQNLNSEKNDCYGAPKRAPQKGFADQKILLAQMNPSEARQLAAKLKGKYHFDVVVTDQDPDLFTPNQLTIVDPNLTPEAPLDGGAEGTSPPPIKPCCDIPSFVAIPPPAWKEPFAMDPARLLQVTYLAHNRWEYLVRGAKASRFNKYPACNHCIVDQATALFPPLPPKDENPDAVQSGNSPQVSQGFTQLLQNAESAFKGRMPLDLWKKEQKLAAIAGTDKADGIKNLAEEAFQDATLLTLLEQTHADVALMEKQDFYFGDPVGCLVEWLANSEVVNTDSYCGKKIRDMIDRHQDPLPRWQILLSAILWKGDILTVLPVRGSVLQAVMTHSKQYDENDKLGLAIGDDLNRGLVTLGLKEDPGQGGYSVNDMPLDPNRVYTVATTDYIALGDTGYPELNDSTLKAVPQPLYAKRPLNYISNAVCLKTSDQPCLCASTFKAEDYFDALSVKKPLVLPPQGTTWKEQIRQWASWRSVSGHNPSLADSEEGTPPDHTQKQPCTDRQQGPTATAQANTRPCTALQEQAQERPKWEWALTKGSVGFTVQRDSETPAELASNFGGVSSVPATAPRSHNWNIDEEMAFTRSVKWADFLVSQQMLYTASFADTSSFRNPNQSVDMWGVTVGPRFNLLPEERKRPHFALDTFLHFETQPVNILESLKVKNGSVPLQFYLPRTKNVVAQVGPGWYNNKSYFETGIEGGKEFGAFREFDFTNPGSSPIPCFPTAAESLPTCILANPSITPATGHQVLQETRPLSGFFWHNLLLVPTGSRITTSLENQGEIFFNFSGDNTTQTRLQHLLTGKVSFQIWPSLSFSPTYQLFLYENKVQNKFLWQQGAMITLNYQFSFTNRGIAGSQFRYKSAQGQ